MASLSTTGAVSIGPQTRSGPFNLPRVADRAEVESRWIDPQVILKLDPLPRATSEEEFDDAIKQAEEQGYDAVWFDEGPREPNSIYVLNRRALRHF